MAGRGAAIKPPKPARLTFAGWRQDVSLRACSLAARGLWMDMLSLMDSEAPVGILTLGGQPMPEATLARLVGATLDEVRQLLDELRQAQVFVVDPHGRIVSRRMVQDAHRTRVGRANGERGGNPTLRGAKCTISVSPCFVDEILQGVNPPLNPFADQREISPTDQGDSEIHPASAPVDKSVDNPVDKRERKKVTKKEREEDLYQAAAIVSQSPAQGGTREAGIAAALKKDQGEEGAPEPSPRPPGVLAQIEAMAARLWGEPRRRHGSDPATLAEWLAAGHQPEQILAVVGAVMARIAGRGEAQPRALRFFGSALTDAASPRPRAAAQREPAMVQVEQSESIWAARLSAWNRGRVWMEAQWGPPPGSGRCWAPKRALTAAGLAP